MGDESPAKKLCAAGGREHALRFSASLIAKSALLAMRKTSFVISSKNKGEGYLLVA